MKTLHLIFPLASLLFIACGTPQSNSLQEDNLSTLSNTLQREFHPQASPQELETLSVANNQFTIDTYTYLEQDKSNGFLSAYSIYNMLGMLSAGAVGETKEQMLQTMHLPLANSDDIHRQFNALDLQFPRASTEFHVSIANALWIQNGMQIKEPFLNTLTKNYGVAIRKLDFEKDSAKARESINQWTATKTAGKIKELIPQNGLNANTKILLTNAIYLKAQWQHKFAQQNTLYRNFTTIDKEVIQVPTMHQKLTCMCKEVNGTAFLSMNYVGGKYRLLSILPAKGTFTKYEKNLNTKRFREMITDLDTGAINLQEKMVDLYYPKYEFEGTINLVKPLKQHGMVAAFGENADFSNITNDAHLNISNIIQKTFFKVDEEGTQAATSSAVTIGTTSLPEMTLKFDRPFLFVLYYEATKTILFLGRVMNPLVTSN